MPSLRTIYETRRSRGPQTPPWVPTPPETRQTSIFLFSSLYTSMMTKNKLFTFPARLTPLAPVLFAFSSTTNTHSNAIPVLFPFEISDYLPTILGICRSTLTFPRCLIQRKALNCRSLITLTIALILHSLPQSLTIHGSLIRMVLDARIVKGVKSNSRFSDT